jgi:hypothetical protein
MQDFADVSILDHTCAQSQLSDVAELHRMIPKLNQEVAPGP